MSYIENLLIVYRLSKDNSNVNTLVFISAYFQLDINFQPKIRFY